MASCPDSSPMLRSRDLYISISRCTGTRVPILLQMQWAQQLVPKHTFSSTQSTTSGNYVLRTTFSSCAIVPSPKLKSGVHSERSLHIGVLNNGKDVFPIIRTVWASAPPHPTRCPSLRYEVKKWHSHQLGSLEMCLDGMILQSRIPWQF